MPHAGMHRRTMLKGATAVGALAVTSNRAFAQPATALTAKGPGAKLPA
jgi:hypothetical protein